MQSLERHRQSPNFGLIYMVVVGVQHCPHGKEPLKMVISSPGQALQVSLCMETAELLSQPLKVIWTKKEKIYNPPSSLTKWIFSQLQIHQTSKRMKHVLL
jgi:hypothetical protein